MKRWNRQGRYWNRQGRYWNNQEVHFWWESPLTAGLLLLVLGFVVAVI